MRIISGSAAGIRLDAPPGHGVRPTGDRVRESVFASLGDIRGFHAADLFAGSGSLGLEALSRGAQDLIFVENSRRHQRTLHANLKRVLTTLADAGQNPQAAIRNGDAWTPHHLLPQRAGHLDLILMDPPYADAEQDGPLQAWLRDADIAAWAANALLLLEHPRRFPLPWHPLGRWRPLRQKQYGDTMITFARAADGPAPHP